MTKIAITGSNGRMGQALIEAVKLNPNVSQGQYSIEEMILIECLKILTF